MLVRPAAPVEAVAGQHSKSIVYYLIRNRQLGRSYVSPFNPQTELQSTLRAMFATISAAWKTATDEQAIGWENLAEQLGRSDSLGRQYGFYVNNAFMHVNLYRLIDGQTITMTAPAYEPPPPPLSISEVRWSAPDQLDVDVVHEVPAGSFFFVQATPFLSSARRKARRNELRIPTASLAASIVARASSPQIISLNPTRLGLPETQGFIGVRVLALSSAYLPGGELFVPSLETFEV